MLHSIYRTLWPSPESSPIERAASLALYVLIVVNVVCVIIESVEPIRSQYAFIFEAIEYFSVLVFTIEYILRIVVCPLHPNFQGHIRGRVKYVFSPLGLIDLLAILPFYLPMVVSLDLRFLRVLRLLRILRVLKLYRYSSSLAMLVRVMVKVREELLVTLFVLTILLVFLGSVMYLVEKDEQPETFSSIPASMWYTVITLTTVGYGDVYPKTLVGKVIAGGMAILGIGLFALPTGLLSSAFVEEMKQSKRPKKLTCEKCGHVIKEEF